MHNLYSIFSHFHTRLKDEIEDLKFDADHEQKRFKAQRKTLQKKIFDLEKEVEFLTQYKKGYDALEEGKVQISELKLFKIWYTISDESHEFS